MEQAIRKSSYIHKNKNRQNRPHSESRININWQNEDWKPTLASPPYKCFCSLCYKQHLKIPGAITERFPSKVAVDKTKFLFNSLISKSVFKPLNIMIVDSYPNEYISQRKESSKNTNPRKKSLRKETKIQNSQDASSLLSRNSKTENLIPLVNARYCNIMIPEWSQFNQSCKNTFNVRIYRKGDAPEFTSRRQSTKSYSAVVYYKDGTMVLLSQKNFDKMMKDRREGNPHVHFIQSYVKSKLATKQNYYGILITNYNIQDKYSMRTTLLQAARTNIMKYLNKDPFAVDDINEDFLSTEELATYYMYRVVEYLKETQDIIIQSITLAWMYSINGQLFLSYCSELEYHIQQKIEEWKPQNSQVKAKSPSEILSEPVSEAAQELYCLWQTVKLKQKQKSKQKSQKQKKMYTDKSQIVFNLMFPQGDFARLKNISSRTSRFSRVSTAAKKSLMSRTINVHQAFERVQEAKKKRVSTNSTFFKVIK